MPTYSVNAINVGSFNLGESDKIITLFSAERGLIRAVAKGARKPGSKIAGRAELLAVNRLLLANGRSLDIITQAETLDNFRSIRTDLIRLSYALYYAELTVHLGQGLNQESQIYFELLVRALKDLSNFERDPNCLCLNFQLSFLQLLGLKPELECCVLCRKRLVEYDLSVFDHDLGGAICNSCFSDHISDVKKSRISLKVLESKQPHDETEPNFFEQKGSSYFTYLTPLVWKKLLLAAYSSERMPKYTNNETPTLMDKALSAARHLLETYIEHRSGKKMKSLGLI